MTGKGRLRHKKVLVVFIVGPGDEIERAGNSFLRVRRLYDAGLSDSEELARAEREYQAVVNMYTFRGE